MGDGLIQRSVRWVTDVAVPGYARPRPGGRRTWEVVVVRGADVRAGDVIRAPRGESVLSGWTMNAQGWVLVVDGFTGGPGVVDRASLGDFDLYECQVER